MEDTEDDARYPPNPYPPKRRHTLSSSSREGPFPPVDHRRFAAEAATEATEATEADEDEEDEEEDEEEQDYASQAMEADGDEEEDEDRYYDVDGDGGGEDEGGSCQRDRDRDPPSDSSSSSESRGKRRRLDTLALGFELAARVPPPLAAAASAASPSAARTSPVDWSEPSTLALLDAWGELFVKNGRKSLRADEWAEVTKKVNKASNIPRSDAQCRNRVDTLKKKYKKEKAKMAAGSKNPSSDWIYFEKMDALMSSPSPAPPVASVAAQEQCPRLPVGVDAGEYVFTSSRFRGSNGADEMWDSPGDTGTEDDEEGEEDEEEEEESDGLPPMRTKASGRSEPSSFRMLADSIQKFGEIYEKIESSKRQQMLELERMRKEFQRDLEVQKRQILERAQAEIAKIQHDHEEDEEEEGEEENGADDDEVDDLSV